MDYSLKRSKRAKHMRLVVQPGGRVILTAPCTASMNVIETFLAKHASWIERGVAHMRKFTPLPARGRRAYIQHKEEARIFVTERVAHWNTQYNFKFNRIAIKNTTRVWGSCSRKANLNFSYALLFLPRHIADYVVVHELCHLQENNHSPAFWALVAQTIPHFKACRTELRRYIPSA